MTDTFMRNNAEKKSQNFWENNDRIVDCSVYRENNHLVKLWL
jgi:hypothetical protein